MQLVYRGQQYLPRTVLTEPNVEDDVCVYRGISYRRTQGVVAIGGITQQSQQFKYRGIRYTKQIGSALM